MGALQGDLGAQQADGTLELGLECALLALQRVVLRPRRPVQPLLPLQPATHRPRHLPPPARLRHRLGPA